MATPQVLPGERFIDHDLHFRVQMDGVIIDCIVSREALNALGCFQVAGDGARLSVFKRHYPTILDLVVRKVERGEFERGPSVLVRTDDLHP